MANHEYGTDDVVNRANELKDAAVDKVSEFGAKAADKVESKASQMVGGLKSAAAGVRDTVDDTVQYFRGQDLNGVLNDLNKYVKAHPTQALIGAVAVGFFAGRMLRRD